MDKKLFDNYNLRVKRLISDCTYLGRSEILNNVEAVKDYLYLMTNGTSIEQIYEVISEKIDIIEAVIKNCNDLRFLNDIKEKYIYGFDVDAVNFFEENVKIEENNYRFALEKCNSIHELSHAVHYSMKISNELETSNNEIFGKIGSLFRKTK